MDKLFKTRDEAVGAALEWARSQNERHLPGPCIDPIHAMWGVQVTDFDTKVAFSPTSWKFKNDRFLYPRFAQPLEAVIKIVTASVLIQTMIAAKEGLFATADDEARGFFQTCQYDLDRGMSFVSGTPMIEIVEYQGPGKETFCKLGWNQGIARRAIGGYDVAQEAELATLRERLTPFLAERGYGLNKHSVIVGLG